MTLSSQALKIQVPLAFLLMLTGMVIAAFVGYFNFHVIKERLDLVYFGNHAKITKLQNLNTLYGSDLFILAFEAKNKMIEPSQAARKLGKIKENINEEWSFYKLSDKDFDSVSTLVEANNQIEVSLQELDAFREILAARNQVAIDSVPYKNVLSMIEKTRAQLSLLIERENSKSFDIKKEMDANYDFTMRLIWLILGATIVLAVGIATFVGRKIAYNNRLIHSQADELKRASITMEELAVKDSLTGVYSRHYFDLVFQKELNRASRENKSVTFIMLDIDYFKLYNDTYGANEGDLVLQRVARTLDQSLRRAGDHLFRLGGEEFCALVLDLNEENSVALCKKIIRGVEQLKIPHDHNPGTPFVTISVGAICFAPTPQTDVKKVIEAAGRVLYHAKKLGRNQAVVTTQTDL